MKEERAEARPPTSRPPRQTPEAYPTGPTEVDELLTRVRQFEKAARDIADDGSLPVKARCVALLQLSKRARHQELSAFYEAALWRGCRHFIEGDQRVPQDLIEANRRLLRRGLTNCPTCRRPLPDGHDLDRWRELCHDLRRPA